jgi:hypothetical protein
MVRLALFGVTFVGFEPRGAIAALAIPTEKAAFVIRSNDNATRLCGSEWQHPR